MATRRRGGRRWYINGVKKATEVAFLAATAGLEHEAHAYRTAGTTGSEIARGAIETSSTKVDLLDLDLQVGAFIEQGFHPNTPTAACDVFGYLGGARAYGLAIFKTQLEVSQGFIGQHGARGDGHRPSVLQFGGARGCRGFKFPRFDVRE